MPYYALCDAPIADDDGNEQQCSFLVTTSDEDSFWTMNDDGFDMWLDQINNIMPDGWNVYDVIECERSGISQQDADSWTGPRIDFQSIDPDTSPTVARRLGLSSSKICD